MATEETQKPSFDEWIYWAQVVLDRLTSVVHVYNKPPHPDAFIPENERQLKVSQAVDILRRLHPATDENNIKLPRGGASADSAEAQIIADIQPLFRDVLHRLPCWSTDMQTLLKSPWFDNCNGHFANVLFRGPGDRENEGIGSGMPIHGRLPEVIQNMLERESIGDSRAPREEKPRTSDLKTNRDELSRLWTKRNISSLRSAGRID